MLWKVLLQLGDWVEEFWFRGDQDEILRRAIGTNIKVDMTRYEQMPHPVGYVEPHTINDDLTPEE